MGADAAGIIDRSVQATAGLGEKYLSLSLAGEEYGIGILKVKEIIGLMPIKHRRKQVHALIPWIIGVYPEFFLPVRQFCRVFE